MTTKDTGGAAFPDPARAGGHCMGEGMTLRDYAAIQLLAAMIGGIVTRGVDTTPDDMTALSRAALFVADAMIAERTKQ